MQVDFVIRFLGIDGGTLAEVTAEAIDDGILGFQGSIVAMGEHLSAGGTVDHKGTVAIEHLLPTYFIDLFVEFLIVVGIKLGKGLQYCQRRATGIVGPVEHTHISFELDGTVQNLHILGSQGPQFVGQHFLEADHRLGHHFEFLAWGGGLIHHAPMTFLYYHRVSFVFAVLFRDGCHGFSSQLFHCIC